MEPHQASDEDKQGLTGPVAKARGIRTSNGAGGGQALGTGRVKQDGEDKASETAGCWKRRAWQPWVISTVPRSALLWGKRTCRQELNVKLPCSSEFNVLTLICSSPNLQSLRHLQQIGRLRVSPCALAPSVS